MKLIAGTNVLISVIVNDQPEQARLAKDTVRKAAQLVAAQGFGVLVLDAPA
ncbi:hypothetical protein [Jiella sp. M17.18]|uniref:hypothetical protein n=1 Tax=Jiella sp. M17.18 TaxID=3234247 RepID=UPI0034DF4062